jgi:hypothetical protein
MAAIEVVPIQWTCGCGKEVLLIVEGPGGKYRASQRPYRPRHCEKDEYKILAGNLIGFFERRGTDWVPVSLEP